jgi:hypothetical protein
MSEDQEHNPWVGRAVRFSCGAVVGLILGLGGLTAADTGGSLWIGLAVSAVIGGLLAATYKDRFWDNDFWDKTWWWLWW